jgi:PEP-CTERM motif-containing protein
MRAFVRCFCMLGVFSLVGVSQAAVVPIPSNRDTTIFSQHLTSSDGGGVGMFVGTDGNGSISRGLIGFDIAGNVPAGATIDSVQLTLNLGQVAGSGTAGSGPPGDPTTRTISLSRVSADWREGTAGNTSTTIAGTGSGFPAGTGDATWNNRIYSPTTSTAWTTAGGDFSASASGSTSVDNPPSVPTAYVWTSTPAMVADVQSWLNNPLGNFGWMLTNSNESSKKTFRAFYTRDATQSLRPSLLVSYTAVPEPGTLTLLAIGACVLGFSARRKGDK